MGGAFVAVADDASAVYWNPAGIATGANFDFQMFRGDDRTRIHVVYRCRPAGFGPELLSHAYSSSLT